MLQIKAHIKTHNYGIISNIDNNEGNGSGECGR